MLDGVSWEYLCAGRGEQALLFLHGMAGAWDIWWQQIEALQDRFRIVSLTYPAVDSLEGLRRGINAVLGGRRRAALRRGRHLAGRLPGAIPDRTPAGAHPAGRIRQHLSPQ